MPSIPQSLLWISLVVLWLFVLVPMLINKRDTVRRTSDVALATRVINNDAKSRLIRRGGPATGHRHDPDWQRDDESGEDFSDSDEVEEYDEAVRAGRAGGRSRSVMVVASANRSAADEALTEPVYLDVDVVDENSGALPVGSGVQESLFDSDAETDVQAFVAPTPDEVAAFESEAAIESEAVFESAVHGPSVDPEYQQSTDPRAVSDADPQDTTGGEYEYIDDTSGLEAEAAPEPAMAPRRGNRQRRLESTTAAEVSARKYRFRKRVLMVMAAMMIATAVASFTLSTAFWWACGTAAAVTVLYLGYLRRQTRIEEQVRRRRQQRMARLHPDMERDSEWGPAPERRMAPEWRAGPERRTRPERRTGSGRRDGADFDDFGSRYQRVGTAVLEIDDEDPIFEHLDEVPYSRRYDLPRAAGQ
jgi:hypothetical protein